MKKLITIIGVTFLAVSLFVVGAFAQGGPSANRPYYNQTGIYNAVATGEKVEVVGTVQSVLSTGYTVTLSDGKTVKVGFGPYWYLEKIGLNLKVGDQITMTGVYVNDYFVPITVVKDGTTYTLRDADGRPLWIADHTNTSYGGGTGNAHGNGHGGRR